MIKNETLMHQNEKYCAEYIDVSAQYEIFWKFRRKSFAAFGEVKKCRRSEDF
jgi:hypothetical protein